jgi:hypothetical protein
VPANPSAGLVAHYTKVVPAFVPKTTFEDAFKGKRVFYFARALFTVERLEHVLGKNPLNLIDVQLPSELLLDGHLAAGNPYLKLRLEIEVPCGIDAEVGDAFIRKRMILDLVTGEALSVDEDKPLVSEHEKVSDELICLLDLFSRC